MRRTTVVFLLAVVLLVPSIEGRSAAVGPLSVPSVAYAAIAAPSILFLPPSHLACLIRAQRVDQGQIDRVDTTMVCYVTFYPSPPPVPPPPPFEPLVHRLLSGSFNETTGALSVVVLPCTAFQPNVAAVSVTLSASLPKTGAATGVITVAEDRAAPFNCATPDPNTTATTGPLTLTPLPNNHNEDRAQAEAVLGVPELCTDYRELGAYASAGGLRDPFNPFDFYDPTSAGGGPPDGYIDLPNDITGVIARYSASGGEYDVAYDRGPAVGPNAWNREGPDGTIDLPNDIMGVISQYQHDCT